MNFYDNTQILNIIIVILIILILYLIFFNQEDFGAPVCKAASDIVSVPSGCTFDKICSSTGKINTKVTGICNNKKYHIIFQLVQKLIIFIN